MNNLHTRASLGLKSRISSMKNQKGLSLIELLVVIGLAAVVIATALSAYQTTSDANKVSQAVKDLGALNAGVKSAFAASPNFSGVTSEVAYKLGIVPSNMKADPANNLIESGFGTVLIADGTGAGDAGAPTLPGTSNTTRLFSITFQNVPEESCNKFVTQTSASAELISINSTFVKDQASGDTVADIAEVTANCNQPANNEITWGFR